MRRDYLTWGAVAFVIGALLVWALPDPGDAENRSAARGDVVADDNVYAANAGENAADTIGWLGMLAGIGLALAGLFKDSAAETATRRGVNRRV